MATADAEKIAQDRDPKVWERVRDRIEEIESRLGLLGAQISHERSEEVASRIDQLNARFLEVMQEFDKYDDENRQARQARCEFESLIKNNRFMRDRHDY